MTTGRLNIPENQSLLPPEKKMFLAKITKSNSEGYNIETVIEGKPLHGFVFLNKPNTLNPATNTSSRYVFFLHPCPLFKICYYP